MCYAGESERQVINTRKICSSMQKHYLPLLDYMCLPACSIYQLWYDAQALLRYTHVDADL